MIQLRFERFSLVFLIICLSLRPSLAQEECEQKENVTLAEYYLFDFTNTSQGVDGWTEQSDTVRTVGMSKAALVINENVNYSMAVFFSLINPQENGAGFAGMRYLGNFNLQGYTTLQIYCRGQGKYYGYKIVLRHKCLNDEPNYTYEQYFQAPEDEFAVLSLPLSDFEAYYHGLVVNGSDPLEVAQITSIGLQAYGGVYLDVDQKGTASLEIDWIRAIP